MTTPIRLEQLVHRLGLSPSSKSVLSKNLGVRSSIDAFT